MLGNSWTPSCVINAGICQSSLQLHLLALKLHGQPRQVGKIHTSSFGHGSMQIFSHMEMISIRTVCLVQSCLGRQRRSKPARASQTWGRCFHGDQRGFRLWCARGGGSSVVLLLKNSSCSKGRAKVGGCGMVQLVKCSKKGSRGGAFANPADNTVGGMHNSHSFPAKPTIVKFQ